MEKEKILYYLGAGASATALPISKTVLNSDNTVKIEGLIHSLKETKFTSIVAASGRLIGKEKDFIDFAASANEHGDIDTYAKLLYLQGEDGLLEHLKQTLEDYFIIKQLLDEKRDRRYLPWLISLMEKRKFPDNVNIVSWNYDFQVELAAKKFDRRPARRHDDYYEPFIEFYPTLDPKPSPERNISLWHLNGIAGVKKISGYGSHDVFSMPRVSVNDLEKLFVPSSGINFAWERDRKNSLIKDSQFQRMIKDTTIIVVIGYSFPFYNREIDKFIFQTIADGGLLRKIYYQDPIIDGQQLPSQFNLANNIPIVHIPYTDGFHIPYEY